MDWQRRPRDGGAPRRHDGSPDPEESAVASPRGRRLLPSPPPLTPAVAQALMVGVQAAVCVGAVYLKAGLSRADAAHPFHPAVFAFFREAAAGVLLCGAAAASTGVTRPRRADVPALLGAGVCLFASQALYVHGIDAAGVAVAASLQPAVPIWTAALGVATGAEKPTRQKLAGVALAAAGALCMVSGPATATTVGAARAAAGGKAALAAGTLAMALFYRATARLVRVYPPLCVAGWAYVPAAAAMGVAALASAPVSAWGLAPPLRGPLAFWVSLFLFFFRWGVGRRGGRGRAHDTAHTPSPPSPPLSRSSPAPVTGMARPRPRRASCPPATWLRSRACNPSWGWRGLRLFWGKR
jgi:drug/metabolite transporter (DMT)-like permease